MGKKMKVSPKGRFCFLQLSDAEGTFEVSIFKEELLTQHRELLENGQLLLVGVDAKQDDGGARLIATSFTPLEQAVAGVKPAAIRIVIDNNTVCAALKSVLGEAKLQGQKVSLQTTLSDKRLVDIALPEAYTLTAATLMQMSVLAGVKAIEEV